MFFRALWGISLCFSSYVQATAPVLQQVPVLIRAPGTPLLEFSAYSETEPVQTYIQYQLEKTKKTPRPVNLRALLKQAQMDFLSHEPNHSKKSFRAIADSIHSFEWNKEERKIIFYALFRLAQLEKNNKKQTLLLKEALAFSMGLKVDHKLFPPPLAKQYAYIKKSATFVPLHLKQIFPLHPVVILNGRIYSHQEEIALPYGLYRVSALSASHESWTQTLSLSRLISKKVKTPALAGGSCEKPLLKYKPLQKQNTRLLFPNFCVWNSTLSIAKKENQIEHVHLPMTEDLDEPENKSHYEEWIWLGAALAIGGIAIWAFTRDSAPNKPPNPTEKESQKPIVKIGF